MKNLSKWPVSITGLVLCVLLVACSTTRYEYHPPATEQGRICVTHCAGVREMCQGNEINRAQSERFACEQRSESMYRSCLRKSDNRDESKKCHRAACWANENTWRCDENYRQCFVVCGGSIHMYKE